MCDVGKLPVAQEFCYLLSSAFVIFVIIDTLYPFIYGFGVILRSMRDAVTYFSFKNYLG